METEVLSDSMSRHPLVSLISACFWVIREYLLLSLLVYLVPIPHALEYSMAFVMDQIVRCVRYNHNTSIRLCDFVLLHDAYRGPSLYTS